MNKSTNKAIFLDRDGVINKKLEGDYVKSIDEFELLPKIKEALIEFKNKGYLLIVITNQQGIGKGLMSENDLKIVHNYMTKLLPEIDDIYYCPHLDGTCNCRKPKNEMLLRAKDKWNIDFNKSWMIGDSESDIICGNSVGCKTIKITHDDKERKTDSNYTSKQLFDCINIL
ncbi:D-glycero-alpha-D-manno-heptose-1,7-bisphosphate 7-phosphatase [Methanococcus aeolicus]|uniref:D-glycero-alpha-D-manno-heptose-1,7-bisphosphate 7-phosphatase n=1 Tax=Methanococcus aeolicus TaxID=42879 RepID=UPI0021C6CD18|nr:HAD family hydrolase [Methanococcus aeolicus]UXM85412.1 HAD family hydrolase [Methanococcus aeolicus]